MLPLALESAKAHVNLIHKSKAKNDANSATLANTLLTNIMTSLSGEHKFIFELLQNADDAARQKAKAQFETIETNGKKYLIFSHSGRHFTPQDVEKICDNAQQRYNDKSSDTQKIGYKGIGFKAIFSITDCIHIRSNDYRFRFDKHYDHWQQSEEPYPWPIIPIWTEDSFLPVVIMQKLDPSQVNFIIELKPGINIEEDLNYIKAHPALMLFLKHVDEITIKHQDQVNHIEVKKETEKRTIYKDGNFVSAWTIKEFMIDINDQMRFNLQSYNNIQCPARLKSASATAITFAACTDDQDSFAVDQFYTLYSYLPTQINLGLPYLVNADFLLTAERARLNDNEWNRWLLYTIAYKQFEWLASLTQQPTYRKQILKLIPPPYRMQFQWEGQSFKLGYQKALQEVAFIPAYSNPQLLTCAQAKLDSFDFYKDMELPADNIVDHNLENSISLQSLGVSSLTLEELGTLVLSIPNLKTLSIQLKILNFIASKKSTFPELVKKLKTCAFLLSSQDRLASPNELYFPITEEVYIPSLIQLQFIHPALATDQYKKNLHDIGVRNGSLLALVRGYVYPAIAELSSSTTIDTVYYLALTSLIFQAYTANKLTSVDYEFLKEDFHILNKQGTFIPATAAYLADDYQPDIKLESADPSQSIPIFTAVDPYLKLTVGKAQEATDIIDSWSTFFSLVGVKRNLNIVFLNNYLYSEAAKQTSQIIKNYLTYIKRSIYVGIPSSPNSQYFFNCFIGFEHLDLLTYQPVAEKFWSEFKDNWQRIKTANTDFHTDTSKRRNKQIGFSFIQYALRTFKLTLGSQGGFYLTTDLLSPRFYRFNAWLNVTKYPLFLTEEQSDYIGFRTSLTLDECFSLLGSLNKAGNNNIADYEEIYNQLLKNKSHDYRSASWTGKLPAQSGNLQPKMELYYLDTSNLAITVLNHAIKLPTGWSHEKNVALCQQLGIRIANYNELKLTPTKLTEGFDTKALVLNRLTYLSIVIAKQADRQPQEIYSTLFSQIDSLAFYAAERLSLDLPFSDSIPIDVFIDDNKIFYSNRLFKPGPVLQNFCEKLLSYLKRQTGSDRIKELFDDLSYSKAFAEILSFDEDELNDWFTKQGYSITMLDKPISLQAKGSMDKEPLVAMASQQEYMPLSEQSTLQGKPQLLDQTPLQGSVTHVRSTSQMASLPSLTSTKRVNIQDISMERFKPQANLNIVTNDTPKRIVVSSANHLSPKPHSSSLSAQSKPQAEPNISGEEIVYYKLLDHYQKKYQQSTYEETALGFKFTGLDNQGHNLSLEIIWHNKMGEQGKAKDFTIIKNGRKRIIEVKTTTAAANHNEFFVSEAEMKKLHKHRESYRFFRVENLSQEHVRIFKIKNPSQLIKDNNIRIKSYILKI